MLNSHNDSSLNLYRGIPFPRLTIIFNRLPEEFGEVKQIYFTQHAGELSNKVHLFEPIFVKVLFYLYWSYIGKRLQEQIKDNFMFGAVMTDVENCLPFLQMVLDIPIERVEASKERSIIYHPEYRRVRLDICVKDEKLYFKDDTCLPEHLWGK